MFSANIFKDATGAVALLFRKVINNGNLKNSLERLIDIYSEMNSKDSTEKSKIKTNYSTHVKKGKMTIKIMNVLFIDILKAKAIHYTVDIKYNDEMFSGKCLVKSLPKDDEDDQTVTTLFNSLLKDGLGNDLDKVVDKFTKSNTDTFVAKNKKKYDLICKINSENMSFKSMVKNLHEVFEADYIILTINVEIGKETYGEAVKLNLKEKK